MMFHIDTGVAMIQKKWIFYILFSLFVIFPIDAFSQFSFVQITDTHIGSQKSFKNFKSIIDDIKLLYPKPSFIIHTGDITEMGLIDEFKEYQQFIDTTGIKFYHVMGNHDVRWANNGYKNYSSVFGEAYQSFDFGDVHFILLNSCLLLEQYGHFTLEQLKWLKNDLEKTGTNKPIIMAAHHPLMGSQRYVDNEIEFMKIIENYNVMLYLCGHGHRNEHRRLNSVDFLMTTAVKSESSGYRIFNVDSKGAITVSNRQMYPRTTVKEFTRSSKKITSDARYSFRAPGATKIYDTNLPILMSGNGFTHPEVSINGREWMELQRGGNKYFQNIDVTNLAEGNYILLFRYQTKKDEKWVDFINVKIDRGKTRRIFETDIGTEIHGKATVIDDAFVFGGYNGKIYAVSVDSGKILWTTQTGGPVLTEPAVSEDTVFVTSGDGYCYAYDANTGNEYWRQQVAEAIFSSPAYDGGKVIFGAGDSSIYALRSDNGSLIWQYKTKGHIIAKPAIKYEKVMVGAWDGYFYCLSALNGELKWRSQVSDNIYYSAATSNPLIEINKVFVTSHEHTVFLFDIDNGNIGWKHLATENHKSGYSSPLEFDDKVILGSLSGHLFALSENTGEEEWTASLTDSLDCIMDSSPALNYPSVVAGSVNGTIYAAYIDTGVMNWTYRLSENYIFASPAIKNGIVYIGSFDGNFYAVTELE